MKKWFLIKYVVDTGCVFTKDTAQISAKDELEAHEQLKQYIQKFGSNYKVSVVSEISEFTGTIYRLL